MSNFHITKHTVRAQHSRDRIAGAELGRENELRIQVKRYVPISNAKPRPGDVTIIGAVADAFPKEVFEPLWDDLYERLKAKGKQIRGIWIADPVNQGGSGVLNEHILGPDPSWFDHGRDLLFLINQFQDDILHPIIGIGHSMGAGHLTHLSLLHPRLLHSLILIDPVFSLGLAGRSWAAASATRRDLWSSRSSAASKFRSNPAFKSWDSRVLEAYIKYGLRDLPTEMYASLPEGSNPADPPVTLQTTKAQEQYNYIRAAYHDDRYLLPSSSGNGGEDKWRDFWPEDAEAERRAGGVFTRFENKIFYRRLPELAPGVLYVLGAKSKVARFELRNERLRITGTGAGGSGGAKKGRVREILLDCGHLVPFEATSATADACAGFIWEEGERWQAEEADRRMRWERLSRSERVDINDLWMEKVGARRKERSEQVKQASGDKSREKL